MSQPVGQPVSQASSDEPPNIAGLRLVTAHHVCLAVQDVLEEHLPPFATAAGLQRQVRTWTQVPDARAISEAQLPTGAIHSPGTTKTELTRRGGTKRWDATWRVGVSVFDRGKDYNDTSQRLRTWAALVSTVMDQHGSLGWLKATTTWVAEDLAEIAERTNSRTLQQALVTFDVAVPDVRPSGAPASDGTPGPDSSVRFTSSQVSVGPPPRPANPFSS